jgi:hypothetical protein
MFDDLTEQQIEVRNRLARERGMAAAEASAKDTPDGVGASTRGGGEEETSQRPEAEEQM